MPLIHRHYLSKDIMSNGFDTLSYTNEEYRLLATRNIASDREQIKGTIVGYLASRKAYVRSPETYGQTAGFVEKKLSSKTIAYRESESEYLKELNKLMEWNISEDSLSFCNFKATVEQDTAKASIVEDYKYYIDDDFGDESFRRREYTFEMIKNSEGWKIVDVKTNDPWETEESFSYAEIDVDNVIAEIAGEMKSANNAVQKLPIDDMAGKEEKAATALKRWTYSSADAVTYAANHYSDTSNSVFGFTTGRNCQNFASQCVWAGFGGSGASTSARPAVSTAIAGSDGQNVWQKNIATTCYSSNTYWLNWTWDNARGFANMMKVSKTTLEGPYGNTQYSGYFGYTNVGNILEVDWDGAPARDTLDHAMFVTQVSGTSGSRTTSQVKIAAHTSATNSAYQTLSTYTSMPSSAFSRVIISCGYYATTQP